MNGFLLLARLVLAAVFAVAGLTKLADRRGSRQAMRDFGLAAPLVTPLGILLPLAELAIALLLLPAATAWYGALVALALLLLFLAGIGYQLLRGRAPDCHCFGQLHSEPVGASTLVRNAVLAALAALVAGNGLDQPSVVHWLNQRPNLGGVEMVALIVGAVALVLLAVEGWVLLHLVQQNGRLLLRVEALETTGGAADEAALAIAQAAPAAPPVGLPLGSPAPDFRLAGLHGETMTLDALRAQGKPLLLLFSDPGCGPCNALLPEVTTWQSAQGGPLIALISRGELDANRAKAAEHGLRQVFVQHDREVAERYQAYGTPSAVLVTPEGRVGSPLAQGAEQIRALVAQTTNVPAPTAALAPMPQLAPVDQGGQPAPGFALPDLEGRIVTLDALKGQRTAVLFWNPGCSFCQRMLDDLKEWEAKPRAGAPRLLVVSTGDVATNQGQGFASTVLLDEGFRVGQSFGASGTPSAVLVDEGGRIASAVGVGAPGVLPLLGLAPPAGDRNAGQPAPLPAAKPGQFAPPLKLPDLNGKTVRLSDFKGSKVLALFWNPGCGFCQRMLDDLKAWETQASRDKRAPKLLVISRGSVEEHRGYGLTSTIVLDQEFKLGPAFGAMGTPMGVLIDAQGRVASEVAAGAEAVFALARGDALPVGD